MELIFDTKITAGNDKLALYGLFWLGEDFYSFMVTSITIIFPVFFLFFFCFSKHFFYEKQKHFFVANKYRIQLVLSIVLFFIFKTFSEDPGIIPRSKNSLTKYQLEYLTIGPRYKHLIINGSNFQLKFCETCAVWRSPRTSHCSSCNNCIIKFDHHCPWIGTCVGLRNYRSFLIFISYLLWYLILFLFKIFIIIFSKKNLKILQKILFFLNFDRKIIIKIFLIIFFFVLMVCGIFFTGALLGLHFYLCYIGKTTSELFKTWDKNFWIINSKKEIFGRCLGNKHSSIIIKSSKCKKKKFKFI